MNIYNYAMSIEKEGETLYKDFAGKSENEGLKSVFMWLAHAEKRHYEIFEKMKKNEKAELAESSALKDSEGIFEKLKKLRDNVQFYKIQANVYQKALDVEEKMYEFYILKAEEAQDPEIRRIFQTVAKEELRHQHLMENLINFVRNPEMWIENDEYRQVLEEYFV